MTNIDEVAALQAPGGATVDMRAEILHYADILVRGGGEVPAGDVAWQLRQISEGKRMPRWQS